MDLTSEIVKQLAQAGPFALCFFFLGREVLRKWDEDRKRLDASNARTEALADRAITAIERFNGHLPNHEVRQ